MAGKRTALTALELVIIAHLVADFGATYFGGPLHFGREDAVRYTTEGWVYKALPDVDFQTLWDAVDAALTPEILAAGKLTDDQVKANRTARAEAAFAHDRAALACFEAGDFAGALAEIDAGELVYPAHGGPVSWDTLRGHVNAKAAAVAGAAA